MPDISNTTAFPLETLDGGSNPQTLGSAGREANLDIQYIVGIATDVSITFLSVGSKSNDGLGGFLGVANCFLAADASPQVVTTSYAFDESGVTASLATNLCNAYMQLGARGVSLLFGSGDGGVAGFHYGGEACDDFLPTFPSGCTYVTSVGATQEVGPETAAPCSGAIAVADYTQALGSTYGGLCNTAGRGNYQIVLNGGGASVVGTSASTPTFASIIALLNNELALAYQSPLGFLNPWLYGSAASALNDITSGSNPGCSTEGFPAAIGRDPVTGLGTLHYAELRTAAGL
ncbi:peptidase S8/S53 domain-containing protein [Sparassis latifolia]